MAITVRKGNESQFDINKMLPGEFAVTTDTHKVYVCMAAGISKELASIEELQNILGSSEEAFQAFQELINAMESDTVITGLLSDINNIKSGEYTISFSEAEERSNIENTDTIKVILGKIRKFFSSFSAVAFSGKYADLGDKPILGDAASKSVANNMTTSTAGTHVADAYQVKLLKGQLDEQNTNLNFKRIGTVTFGSNWSGTISVGKIAPHIGIIWGNVKHLVADVPAWGETVLTLSDYTKPDNTYYIPLNAFATSGKLINSFVFLPSSGTVKTYNPDNSLMNEANKEYNIWGVFYC